MGFYQNLYDVIREGKPLAVKPEQARDVIIVLRQPMKAIVSEELIKPTL